MMRHPTSVKARRALISVLIVLIAGCSEFSETAVDIGNDPLGRDQMVEDLQAVTDLDTADARALVSFQTAMSDMFLVLPEGTFASGRFTTRDESANLELYFIGEEPDERLVAAVDRFLASRGLDQDRVIFVPAPMSAQDPERYRAAYDAIIEQMKPVLLGRDPGLLDEQVYVDIELNDALELARILTSQPDRIRAALAGTEFEKVPIESY